MSDGNNTPVPATSSATAEAVAAVAPSDAQASSSSWRDWLPQGPQRRVLVLALVVPAVAAVILWSSLQTKWLTVVRDLTADELTAVVATLQQAGVQFRVEGNDVAVPDDAVYTARLLIARIRRIDQQTPGFELFDEAGIEASRFGQRITYKRALEGEIARTLSHLEGVEAARVHLTFQERSALNEESVATAASVVLHLDARRHLADEDIDAVRTLVAGAAEGLRPEQVTIVDQHGNLLASGFADEGPDGDVRRRSKLEEQLEAKLNRMLLHAWPDGSAAGTVRVELEDETIREAEETYDPAGAVVRSEERVNGGAGTTVGGVAGIQGGATAGATPGLSRQLTNYEISRRERERVRKAGAIRKLSAVVILRGVTEPTVAADTLERLQRLAAAAIGIDPARGDQLEVIPVATPAPAASLTPPQPEAWWMTMLPQALRYLPVLLAALLVHFWLIRPLRRVTITPPARVPVTVEQIEARLEAGAESETHATPTPVPIPVPENGPEGDAQVANIDPDRLARTIARWVQPA